MRNNVRFFIVAIVLATIACLILITWRYFQTCITVPPHTTCRLYDINCVLHDVVRANTIENRVCQRYYWYHDCRSNSSDKPVKLVEDDTQPCSH